jgi:hypothetical protein
MNKEKMSSLLEDIVLNLKVIAKLSDHRNEQFKLNVGTGEPVIQKITFFSPITRFFSGESRSKTLEFVTKTFQNCHHLVDMYLNSTYMEINKAKTISQYQKSKAQEILTSLQSLSTELENSIGGLDALKETYTNDCTISARIEILKVKAQRMILTIAQAVEQVSNSIHANPEKKEKTFDRV